MNIMELLNINKNPLPVAFIVYLTISAIIIYFKPSIIFGSDNDNDENGNKYQQKIWIFFILLAVFVYGVISSYVSNSIRNNYLKKMNGGDISDIIDMVSTTSM